MKNNKSILQNSALYSGYASFILAVVSVIFLFIKVEELTWQHPISASLLASSFFFVFVGIVLLVVGKTNLPSFKVTDIPDVKT